MTLAVLTKECLNQNHHRCSGLILAPDDRVPPGQPSLDCECPHHGPPKPKGNYGLAPVKH